MPLGFVRRRDLFEFYFSDTGSGTSANLLQQTQDIRAGIARNLADMQSMVRVRPSEKVP